MGVKPRLTRDCVARARGAFQSVADLPEWERLSREVYGDAEVEAITSSAGHAAKIAAIWAKMNEAERETFLRALTAQVGEIPDTLSLDLGDAAQVVIDNASGPGKGGRPVDFPGLREAVETLLVSWEAQGGAIQPGRLYTTDGRQYPGLPPMRPTPTVLFVAAGVLRAIPEHYRMMDWPDAKRRLLQECWRQVDQIHRQRSR